MNQQKGGGVMTLHDYYEMAMRISQSVFSIVTTPVEYFLRPTFGTRYFEPLQLMLTCLMMMALPAITGLTSMFSGGQTQGIVGLGTLSTLFFAAHLYHGPRLWLRIFYMEREQHSQFEGDALPFFGWLPFGHSFWIVRIFYEPAFVVGIGILLGITSVLTQSAATYLVIAGVMLSAKNYLSWYQSWLRLRILMDARFAGPLVAKAVSGKATENELASVHMAGFVGNAPADIKAIAIAQMAPPAPTLPPEIAQLVSAVEPVGAGAA